MEAITEMVKQQARECRFTELNEHQQKLEGVLRRIIVKRNEFDINRDFVRKALDLNYRYFVDTRFALKFKYHASLMSTGDDSVGRMDCHRVYSKLYHYRGDVPDFILDNLTKIKEVASFPILTVHSQEKLPLEIEKVPKLTDPLVVWWETTPQFHHGYFNRWIALNHPLGVVVGIWDGEKEVQII